MISLPGLLRRLPKESDEITQFFVRAGIRGDRCSLTHCPLANWLTDRMGRPCRVGLGKAWVAESNEIANLPAHLLRWVDDFDADALPGGEALWFKHT
jgi:hypothetical protein